MNIIRQHKISLFAGVGFLVVIGLLFAVPKLFRSHYISVGDTGLALANMAPKAPPEPVFVPSYVETPKQVKGIYMTSWTAGTPSLRNGLVSLIDTTELNTVVIDIKDYTGKIVFPVTNPELKAFGSEEVRIRDLKDFIESLHKKGIYVIARIAVFQDAYFVTHRPDLAVKNKAGTAVWKDRKGIAWIDAGAREYWDYIILLSRESREIGFDEINFDYIRFPSDGDMKNISYPFASTTPKQDTLRDFFAYTHDHLATSTDPKRMKISADLFGMVTTAQDDMGIGQVLEKALPYFDYIMPMVYPSHYPKTFQGFNNPAEHPYDVVHFAMAQGVRRAEAASSTPLKLRPWLQDFDLAADYGPAEVRAQIKATYDVGLTSWILWSASNKYTKAAMEGQ